MKPAKQTFELPKDLVLVIADCGVHGGKTIRRSNVKEESEGKSRSVSATVETHVENNTARDNAEQLVARALHIAKAGCILTPIGHLAPRELATAIEAEIQKLHVEAEKANDAEPSIRIHIDVHTIEIVGVLNAHTVSAIAEKIRSALHRLRETIIAGNPKHLAACLRNNANLGSLAVGMQADSIRFALEMAESARYVLREAEKGNATGDALTALAATFDVSSIDAAIIMFTPFAGV